MNSIENTYRARRIVLLMMGVFLSVLAGCSSPTIAPTEEKVTWQANTPVVQVMRSTETLVVPAITETPTVNKTTIVPENGSLSGTVITPENAVRLKPVSEWNAFANTLVFSPDGKVLATAGIDRIIRLYSVPEGDELLQLIDPPDMGYLYSLAFSPDGKLLACGSGDSIIRLWDINTGELVRKIESHIYDVRAVVFSPDGKYLVSGSRDQAIRIWDISTGTQVGHEAVCGEYVNSLAYAPDSSGFIAGCGDGNVRIFAPDGRWWQSAYTYNRVNMVAYSPDSQLFAAAAQNNDVWVFEPSHGWLVKDLVGHEDIIKSVTFHPEGNILVSASLDGTLRLWDTVDWISLVVLGDKTTPFLSAAFSPDGKWLVSSNQNGRLIIWGVEN